MMPLPSAQAAEAVAQFERVHPHHFASKCRGHLLATITETLTADRTAMLRELLQALGLDSARPESPAVVWEEALAKVLALAITSEVRHG